MHLTRHLMIAWLLVALIGLAGLVLWVQASSRSAVAAPEVRVVGVETASGTAAPRDVQTITATLRNDGRPLTNLTVELEVVDEEGGMVLRAPRRGVNLPTGQDQVVSWVWRLPETLEDGRYTTAVTVYGTNWSPVYAQLEDGAVFLVQTDR